EGLEPENFLIPHTKSGNPKIGNFPYSMTHNPAVNEYTYQIPLDDLPGEGTVILIVAHAVVANGCQEETAWANCQGPDYMFKNIFGRGGGNWASVVTLP
ncbi:MAG: hypothetical protein JW702_11095, partial [Clostridiales bacterium]|nr:hypothetical protein [Clostridiales bacterium]